MSNLDYRRGSRTKNQWQKNIKKSTKEENDIVDKWFFVHNKKHKNIFEISECNRLDLREGEIKGNYRDPLDFEIVIKKSGKKYSKVIEVEHTTPRLKKYRYFRFKKDKISRCLRLKGSILYIHNYLSDEPLLRCFGLDWIEDVNENGQFITGEYKGSHFKEYYDGKEYVKLDQHDYDDWVDFDTLDEKEFYRDHMKSLFKSKPKNKVNI